MARISRRNTSRNLVSAPSRLSGLFVVKVLVFMAKFRKPEAVARAQPLDDSEAFRHMAFTFAMIGLSVQLARVDGPLSREEYLSFREVFPLEDDSSLKLRQLFRMAWEEAGDATFYARQVVYLYPEDAKLWRVLLARLIRIALADGALNLHELRWLSEVAQVFAITQMELRHLIGRAQEGEADDPFAVLGITKRATSAQIKANYRELMRQYHPDKVASVHRMPEALDIAHRKSAEITGAYRKVMHKDKEPA